MGLNLSDLATVCSRLTSKGPSLGDEMSPSKVKQIKTLLDVSFMKIFIQFMICPLLVRDKPLKAQAKISSRLSKKMSF